MTDQQDHFTGRRSALTACGPVARSTNPGLWFDKFYKRGAQEKEAENKAALIKQTVELGVVQVYSKFYELWEQALKQPNVTLAIAEVQGRMVIGTGNKGVAEAGMTLHHTYGVPYIPGSALKGLASTYASTSVNNFADPKAPAPEKPADYGRYHIVFGAPNSSGYLTFFDALFIPTSAEQPLAPDVVTGHHGGYYVGKEPRPPADWDSPVPAPFLTATGRYLIAIGGDVSWAKIALELIGCALRDLGIGAKTAASYGRMRLLDLNGHPMSLPVLQAADQATPLAASASSSLPQASLKAQPAVSAKTPTSGPPAPTPKPGLPKEPPEGVPADFWSKLRVCNPSNIDGVVQQWQKLDQGARRSSAVYVKERAITELGEKIASKRKWFASLLAQIKAAS